MRSTPLVLLSLAAAFVCGTLAPIAVADDAAPPSDEGVTDRSATDHSAIQRSGGELRVVEFPPIRVESTGSGDGAESPLRLALRVGHRERVELTIENLKVRRSEDGIRQLERPLPFRTVMLAEVTAMDDGIATVALTVESSVAQPGRLHTIEEAQGMRAAASAMEGLRLDLQLDSTGRLVRLAMEPPRPEDDEHRDAAERQAQRVTAAIARTLVPMPDAPLGVGGRWNTTVLEVFEGVQRTHVVEFTVDRFDDVVPVVTRRTRISSTSQPGDQSKIPGAINVEMSHHSGFGQGEFRRPLDRIFPARSADEVMSTTMTTGRIAGERLFVSDQFFSRVNLESRAVADPDDTPRRRVGD